MTIAAVLRRRRPILAVYAVATALAALGLPRLALDNSPEAYFVRDDVELERQRRLGATFGDFASVRLVLDGPGIWTTAGLEWLGELERRLPALNGVLAAAGLRGRHRLEPAGWPPADPAAFRARVTEDLLDRQSGLVAAGGDVVTLLVALGRLDSSETTELLRRLREVLEGAPPGIAGRVAGLPAIQHALDRAVVDVTKRFFPLLGLLGVLLLGAVLRSAADVLRTLAFVAVTLTCTLGAMGLAGATIDVVTMILPPLLFVLSLATAVHVLLRCRQLRRGRSGPAAAIEATYREKSWPVFWTGATTAVGFGSLATSSVPPVQTLGLWAAGGLAFMTLGAFTLLPALLASGGAAARPRRRGFERRAAVAGRRLATWALGRRRAVLLLFALAALVPLLGLARLRVDMRVISYFPPDDPLRVEVEELEALGVGLTSAELVIEAPPGMSLAAPDARRRLAELAAGLRREPRVLGAVSAADLPDSRPDAPDSGPDARDPFHRRLYYMLMSPDGDAARISLLVPFGGSRELRGLFERAPAAARAAFPGARAWIAGRYPLVLAAQHTLLRTMIVSLALTLACVAVAFAALLPDVRWLPRALAPNLWPVLVVLGAMGWGRVPVDSATVMIASVALGLAVDDTLHYLGKYRRLAGRLPPRTAAVRSLARTAPAHVLTSVILAVGFATCGLAELVPVARFGALTATAIVAALAADLLLVPVLFGTLERTPAAGSKLPSATG